MNTFYIYVCIFWTCVYYLSGPVTCSDSFINHLLVCPKLASLYTSYPNLATCDDTEKTSKSPMINVMCLSMMNWGVCTADGSQNGIYENSIAQRMDFQDSNKTMKLKEICTAVDKLIPYQGQTCLDNCNDEMTFDICNVYESLDYNIRLAFKESVSKDYQKIDTYIHDFPGMFPKVHGLFHPSRDSDETIATCLNASSKDIKSCAAMAEVFIQLSDRRMLFDNLEELPKLDTKEVCKDFQLINKTAYPSVGEMVENCEEKCSQAATDVCKVTYLGIKVLKGDTTIPANKDTPTEGGANGDTTLEGGDNKDTPLEGGDNDTPTKEGDNNTPTKEGDNDTPTKEGDNNTPTKEGDKDTPTEKGDKETLEGDNDTLEGDKETPTKGDKETLEGDNDTLEGDKETPTKGDKDTLEGDKDTPTEKGDKETLEGDNDTLEGDKETPTKGDNDTLEGDKETLEGDNDTLEVGEGEVVMTTTTEEPVGTESSPKPMSTSQFYSTGETQHSSPNENTEPVKPHKSGSQVDNDATRLSTEDYEGENNSHFMSYFLVLIVICIAGYIIFHNKQKIIALVLEGKGPGNGNGRRPSTKQYKQLKTDDVMPSLEKSASRNTYVF